MFTLWKQIKEEFNIEKSDVKLLSKTDDGYAIIVTDGTYMLDIRLSKNTLSVVTVLDNSSYEILEEYEYVY